MVFVETFAAAAMASTQSDDGADAELIALCEAFDRLQRTWSDYHDGGAHPIEDDNERAIALAPLEAQQASIAALTWATKARTLAGAQAKAQSWVLLSPDILDGDGCWDERFRASILRDLARGRRGTNAPAEPHTGVEEDPIAAIAATIQYRRSPATWISGRR